MKFEIVNKEETLITDFNLEANPFKEGEKITININNYNKKFWTAEEVHDIYKIDKIEHYFNRNYMANRNLNTRFTVIIKVTKLS